MKKEISQREFIEEQFEYWVDHFDAVTRSAISKPDPEPWVYIVAGLATVAQCIESIAVTLEPNEVTYHSIKEEAEDDE